MNEYQKDYQTENNTTSVQRTQYDDTLYVLSQFLNQYHTQSTPILDLGSGDCHYHQYFQNHQFIGLDQNKTHKGKSTDQLIEHNIEEFPCPNKIPNEHIPFNFIISLDTFEHLQRPDEVLNYLHQDDHILNKNGYIFLSVPNINTLDDKLNNINQAVYNPNLKNITSGRWNSTHLRFFDFDSICYMAEESGFKIKELTGSNFHTSNLFHQLGNNLNQVGLNGNDYCNMLRNTEFVKYAPNICILLQK